MDVLIYKLFSGESSLKEVRLSTKVCFVLWESLNRISSMVQLQFYEPLVCRSWLKLKKMKLKSFDQNWNHISQPYRDNSFLRD